MNENTVENNKLFNPASTAGSISHREFMISGEINLLTSEIDILDSMVSQMETNMRSLIPPDFVKSDKKHFSFDPQMSESVRAVAEQRQRIEYINMVLCSLICSLQV